MLTPASFLSKLLRFFALFLIVHHTFKKKHYIFLNIPADRFFIPEFYGLPICLWFDRDRLLLC